MATRYLVAMDHVDLHAKKVMRKYAQNRPLGDIERKYQYTLPQPVLSSYHVSTPAVHAYRPKSSVHIIEEQQQCLHDLHSRSRNANSAPASRRVKSGIRYSGVSDHYYCQTPNVNVSVHGRPATSLSEGPGKDRRPATCSTQRRTRPKTTGELKKSKTAREFMVVKVDPEILMSSRRRKELTNQIRAQWTPENHDLSPSQFVRGQNSSLSLSGLDSPRSTGQWLTFGGSSRADNHGVVDAFATLKGDGQSYNIDGHSGSRVAQQLQKGGKIRIGRNGSLLVVKETTRQDEEEESSKEDASRKIVPLCWTDQISSQEAKVVQARATPPTVTLKPKNLCETYPVVFRKLVPDDIQRPKLACKLQESVTSKMPRILPTASLNHRSGQESLANRLGTSNFRNMKLTRTGTTDDGPSHNIEYGMSVSPKESKLDDNSSSAESDQRLNPGTRSSERSKNSDKKATKTKHSSKTVLAESGSHVKLLKVKPSPASLLLYTSPDPELSINVSGTKAELISPRGSSANKKDLPIRDLPTNGKAASSKAVSSVSSTGIHNQSLQPEFIQFATGLISPSIQRRARSAGNTNFAIRKVKEHNRREVSFDLSSPEEASVQNDTCTKDFNTSQGEALKRTNTPVSPEPLSSESPSSPVLVPEETETFAFSIPTAESDKGERAITSVRGDKSPSLSEDKASVWDAQEVQSRATSDSQFEAITALMRESLAVSNPSDYSSQTDSSESHQSEDNCNESMTTNFHNHKHSVRFESGTKLDDSTHSANSDLPSRGPDPKIGDLLSSQLHPDVLDATVEVRRLRQQIRDDLVKQQEDTEDDIHYLRLRQSKCLN
ncbi:uncharacterized protein LOC135470724 [Liolophura sinensis]|uniref:uncharacterized protein LOC135470724 n=1 Tax=Liolophura sinensis TaxID=3198878 RepID=UPI003157F643